jgi:hypothetical protein
MTIASPLSLRWERAQQIDRSTIESLGPTTQTGIRVLPEPFSREHLGPTFWVTLPSGYNPQPVTEWDTPAIGTHSRHASPKAGVTLSSGTAPCRRQDKHAAGPPAMRTSAPPHPGFYKVGQAAGLEASAEVRVRRDEA